MNIRKILLFNCFALIFAGLSVPAAADENRWWPVQAMPRALVRLQQSDFPEPRAAGEMMAQSVAGLAALAGVIVNVSLNCILLPRMGLEGAVLATSVANFTALALMLVISRSLGFALQRSTVTILLVPLCIPLGVGVAALVLAAVGLEIFGSDRLLSPSEKQELAAGASQHLRWFARLRSAN